MPNKVSVCIIKLEIVASVQEQGAVSFEYRNNPRLFKERERDRGLRVSSEIRIKTYTNHMSSNSRDGFPTMSREPTPLEEGQLASEFPKEIDFFSGNPGVEVTNGVIHLYKKNERKEIKEGPSNQLCLLAVPASLSCHDLLNFVAPCHSEIKHIRIIRDGSPNQFIVLLVFRCNDSALEFYQTFNGSAFNSLEPDSLCHAVWVSDVERGEDGVQPLGHTELPICPVCLERMDESVDGVLTILCNHAFHANCLIKWGDSTCPVCRHVQTPELLENSVCMECEGTEALWICLICGHVGCGRYQGGHAAAHYRATNHTYAMQLGTSSVWDYAGDNFVHRLLQNKTDGKLVAAQVPDDAGEEKIDSMQLEFTYLLTSQLDTQRKYYEERINKLEDKWEDLKVSSKTMMEQIATLEDKIQILTKEKQTLERKLATNTNKLKEIHKQFSDECQFSKALQSNQSSWQQKYATLEATYKVYADKKEAELGDINEQLRDIMFYMEAQSKIADSDMKDEIVSGSVLLPGQEKPKSNRRKKN